VYVCDCDCVQQAVERRYQFEPREIKARLDSPSVKAVMEMGYSRDLIREAIQLNLSTTGSLVDAVVPV